MENFDDIRAFEGKEIPEAIERLLKQPKFIDVVLQAMPDMSEGEFVSLMRSCKNARDFQEKLSWKFLFYLRDKTTSGISLDIDNERDIPATYISNHRDIILDSAFFNILLYSKGYDTTEIAIGDNLLIYPWIKDLVRINKSFIVQRSASARQMLEVSKHLSEYIHYAISKKKHSVWIAQREGRAKDSNDRTQESLLKMLSMGGNGNFLDNIRDLNIIPLSISYEYDPCDFLKAAEFQQKRDNPDYKKQTVDDLINMRTGLFGFKGKVHFHVCDALNTQLKNISPDEDKKTVITTIGKMMDKAIHQNYRIYPINYIALDKLENNDRFSDKYTTEEKQAFESYLEKQVEKITIPNKDDEYLQGKITEMYANPLKNKLER